MTFTHKTMPTKYYGIFITEEYTENSWNWYLSENGNGADDHFDHYPTVNEIRDFVLAVS